ARVPGTGSRSGGGEPHPRRRAAPPRSRDLPRHESLREVAKRDRIAVLDRAVRPVEELEEHVRDADALERAPEADRAEVEIVLVALAGIDVDRAQAAQRVGVPVDHADRIPREPASPDVV